MKKLLLAMIMLLCFSMPLFAQPPEGWVGQEVEVHLSSDANQRVIVGKLISVNDYGIVISNGGKKFYINHDFISYIENK